MKKLLSILILCLGCFGFLEAQDVWKPVSAPGYILAVGPNGYLYSTSFESGLSLYRSTDEGLTWEPTFYHADIYSGTVMTVSAQGRLFIVPNYCNNVYYSDDNGDTWQTTSYFPACQVEGMFAVSNDTLLIWGVSGTLGYESLHFTLDGGATWSTADLTPMGQTHHIGDVVANVEGDVFVSFWSTSGQDDGIYRSNYTDADHWEFAAFPNISIKDMELDPDGNVVVVAFAGEFAGFQQVPGFYLAGNEAESLGVADNGVVYICNRHGGHAVLASSQDHGAHFHEMGEMLPISLDEPDGTLVRGHDNYLYFYGDSHYWKSFDEAGFIGSQHTFAPQGAEWYFNINPDMFQVPVSYYRMEVLGETLIQGHQCSVITPPYISDGENQYVYEEDRKVYWYNPTLDAFTTLYDFDAEVGESWICEVGECSCEIRVNSVEDVVYGGRTYRVQNVESVGGDYYAFFSRIIDGMGSVEGLFPYSDACTGIIYDGPYLDFLRCYLVNGEELYHQGHYACDAVYPNNTTCWDGTVAESYEGGDGTEENPYQIATPQQLALLAQQTYNEIGNDAHYILVNDICLNDDGGTLEWPMIGRDTPNGTQRYFRGVFDGNGHTIRGMYMGEYNAPCGLFAATKGAIIKNLNVEDSRILAGNTMGVIVGDAINTSIMNCGVNNCGMVSSISGVVGGVVGAFTVTFYTFSADTIYLKDCTTSGVVVVPGSADFGGGVAGHVDAHYGFIVIENCENYSDIEGDPYAGGIAGYCACNDMDRKLVRVRGCRNYGSVKAGQFGGGIVGDSWGVEISRCFNWGDVVSGSMSGGVAGEMNRGRMLECANLGRVKAVSTRGSEVGGLVGAMGKGVVASSYNRGEVSGVYGSSGKATEAIGGIVGYTTGRIYNVYNAGRIICPELPSGFGTVGFGTIIGHTTEPDHYLNCYWLEQDDLPACGNVDLPDLLGSSAFHSGAGLTDWVLSEPQYGTTDLLEALNYGSTAVIDSVPGYPYLCTWMEDVEGTNDGYPVLELLPTPEGSFQSGDLLYAIVSFNPFYVSVIGHVDGENAQGEIVIPETVDYEGWTYTVTEIADRAFFCCRGIVSIFVPNTVTSIGFNAFYDCEGLQTIHLPESLEVISGGMLFGCYSLTEITLPSTVTEIGEEAFSSCRGLTEIVLPDSVSVIRSEAFSSCVRLRSITFPETMESIGRLAFFNCDSLTLVTLPQGLTTISELLFLSCGRLENVVIPESVTSIEMGAFEGCESLNAIVVPNSVESIGRSAFEACSSLSLVELGSSVSYLAEEVFLTHSLEVRLSLICHNPVPAQCSSNTFPDEDIQGVVMVPCETEEAYRQAWGDYWTSGNFEEDCDGGLVEFHGSEWYYEILNENGSITYQHLEYAADTTVNHKDVQIIIRTNTLYDKGAQTEVTREYLYTEDDVVYWWNENLQEFTVLYDLGAEEGDEWEIKVSEERITMHVDAVEQYYYDGRLYKILHVSDTGDLFGGIIVCGIGHLTSFFPERLMTRGKGYRVEGIRCYWRDGELVFKYGEEDCDEIYKEWHNGIEENGSSTDSGIFAVYPNPTHGILVVETCHGASLPDQTYRITNLMGQTVLTGSLAAETQQIDVSNLPRGMYYIILAGSTKLFIVM